MASLSGNSLVDYVIQHTPSDRSLKVLVPGYDQAEPEWAKLIDDAFNQPLEFPPLSDALTPDDCIAIAIGRGMPNPLPVVLALIPALQQRGVQLDRLQLVLPPAGDFQSEPLVKALQEQVAAGLKIHQHDPDDSGQLAYMAADQDAEPIYMSRLLAEADFVIPLVWSSPTRANDHLYQLFPTYSDSATREAYRKSESAQTLQQLLGKARQAIDALGIYFGLVLIPNSSSTFGQVTAGLWQPTVEVARTRMQKLWTLELPDQLTLLLTKWQSAFQTRSDLLQWLQSSEPKLDPQGATVILAMESAELRGVVLEEVESQDDQQQESIADLVAPHRLVIAVDKEEADGAQGPLGLSVLGGKQSLLELVGRESNVAVVPCPEFSRFS